MGGNSVSFITAASREPVMSGSGGPPGGCYKHCKTPLEALQHHVCFRGCMHDDALVLLATMSAELKGQFSTVYRRFLCLFSLACN